MDEQLKLIDKLSTTGVDLAGAVLVAGLFGGAGLGLVGARRALRR